MWFNSKATLVARSCMQKLFRCWNLLRKKVLQSRWTQTMTPQMNGMVDWSRFFPSLTYFFRTRPRPNESAEEERYKKPSHSLIGSLMDWSWSRWEMKVSERGVAAVSAHDFSRLWRHRYKMSQVPEILSMQDFYFNGSKTQKMLKVHYFGDLQ